MNRIISASVGRGGTNLPQDSKLIQELLNQHISKLSPLRPLAMDGRVGPRTIEAIVEFQKRIVRMPVPDGRVDPNGGTWRLLSLNPLTARPVAGAFMIDLTRKWETSESTVGEFSVSGAVGGEIRQGYILERPGPDATQSGQRKRIPEGTYQLKWQAVTGLAGVQPYLPVPWLYNSQVPESRKIYIHNGNYPKNTDGCLLIGKVRDKDFVGTSVEALKSLKSYLERVGIENVSLRITSSYQR